ncbi:hypothetical protein [Prescottella equi]|uniref:hypothetical protein n=1 Tax=Rhodococcus hoagii TaxID=43767 RepID=UPI001C78AFF0|nr:hypothetical protein [Prescottella equi]BCN44704.1 hypothetical protein RE9414_29840 [Prescottella equi]
MSDPSYTAGTARLNIAPHWGTFFQDVNARLRANQSELQVKVVPEGVHEFRSGLEAQLRSMRPKIKVGVDLDTDDLSSRLHARLAMMRPEIAVKANVDLAHATAEMAAFRQWASRPIHISVNLDTHGAIGGMSTLTSMMQSLGHLISSLPPIPNPLGGGGGGGGGPIPNLLGGGGAGGMGGKAGAIGVAASGATLALKGLAAVSMVPLIGQLTKAAGVLALLPAMATAAAATISTIAIGSTGIKDAFEKGKAYSENGPKEAEAAARAAAAAQRSLEAAQKNAARTAEQGADAIARAERNLADAQKNARAAQDDLTQTRKDAQRQIEDLNLSLRNAQLTEEDAVLSIREAWKRLQEVRFSGADADTVERADLSYRQAIQRLAEVRSRGAELQREADKANAAGIEGAENVVAAKEQIAAADEAVAQAQIDRDRTYRDSAEANAEALQQIADAQEALADAQKSGSASLDAYNEALANLSPSARAFVEATRALGDEWKNLRMSVQEALFDGMGQKITDLAGGYLPLLTESLSKLAEVLNGGLKSAMDWLMTDQVKGDISKVLENTALALEPLLKALGHLGQAMLDITVVGSELLPGMNETFEGGAKGFADTIRRMREDGSLEEWMRGAINAFGTLMGILRNVASFVKSVFTATDDIGQDWMKDIQDTTKRLADWAKSPEGQKSIEEYFEKIRGIVEGLVKIIELTFRLGGAIESMFKSFGFDPFGGLSKLLDPKSSPMERLGGALDSMPATAAPKKLLSGLNTTEGAAVPEGTDPASVTPGKTPIELFAEKVQFVLSPVEKMISTITDKWREFVGSIRDGWENWILPAFTALKEDGLTGVANFFLDKITNGAVKSWQELPAAIMGGVGAILREHFPGLMGGIDKLREKFSELPMSFSEVWNSILFSAGEFVNHFIGMINNGVGGLWNTVDRFLFGKLGAWDPIPEVSWGALPSTAQKGPGAQKVPGLESGGFVPLEPGTQWGKDGVLRVLAPGEFVFSKPAVDAAGVENLTAFNAAARGGRWPSTEGMFAMEAGGRVTRDDPAWEMLKRGHDFAKAQDGKPYQWAGPTGPGSSFDCSGFMLSIAAEILGYNPWQRYGYTGSFNPTTGGPLGFKPGLGAGLSVGVFDNPGGEGGGHMAGTLSGVEGLPDINVESGGWPSMVKYGTNNAAGASNSQFPWKFHLPIVDGAFIDPGPGGGSMGPTREEQTSYVEKFFDKLVGPVRDRIAAAAGSPPPELRNLPVAAFDKLIDPVREKIVENTMLLDVMADAVNKLKNAVTAPATNLLDFVFNRDTGGNLPPGLNLVLNKTGQDEYVMNPEQWQLIGDLSTAAREIGPVLAELLGGETTPAPEQTMTYEQYAALSPEARRTFDDYGDPTQALLATSPQGQALAWADMYSTKAQDYVRDTGRQILDELGAEMFGFTSGVQVGTIVTQDVPSAMTRLQRLADMAARGYNRTNGR